MDSSVYFLVSSQPNSQHLSFDFMTSLLTRIGNIGSSTDDSQEVRLKKTLLIAFSGTMAILSILWGAIYFYFDEFLAGSIPMTYAIVSMVSITIFSFTKNYTFLRLSQLTFSLLLPFLLMVALGGYADSSAVVMWSLTSPLGALVFKGRKEALIWFVAYIILLVIGVFLEGSYPFSNKLPDYVVVLFFAMNIAGLSLTSFVVLRYFVGEKNLALTILESKHQWIKDAFSAYVSPNLVDYLINNPEDLKLGGERRECTFIFTDLVGFTTLVEQSAPSTLVASLNEYFEGMIEIVFKHEGTVSKIVGDAIAVMFSAPVLQKDHANRAIACAMEMDEYAQQFALTKQKQGIDLGRTRIGVNTGNVIIGNIGGKNQLDYRALGDAINVAARLESANKQLGTRVCVSETTVSQCPNFVGRPIGSLLLKGKSKPVATYEPMSSNHLDTEHVDGYSKAFQLMEKDALKAISELERITHKYPNDTLAAYHLSRLKSGKSGTTIVLPWK
ncbi:adenylate/guanylate cyclase domain-containing protein [Flagellimonas pacifica]|uniref:Adenylate cyclase, class 3 n=1 Tax=Flagellimonas pacifica TaxID=1247520 RepID=A0A285MXF9_9FLAO|nr:adenylate/guanylate cyclase domain-containing protein [Allomuricauda parva]SNZ00496.1 Adenylate cyclase, class 3 [Allomuricauda parva]